MMDYKGLPLHRDYTCKFKVLHEYICRGHADVETRIKVNGLQKQWQGVLHLLYMYMCLLNAFLEELA
jgi:hypothetical protein